MRKSLAGTRIRAARNKLGMTQKSLAGAAGVSASYLNLIEHNRRAVAGKLLLTIACVLGVPAGSLADGQDSALVGDLHEAAAQGGQTNAETGSIDEMISRFPGWSHLLATLYRQSRDQEAAIAALSDRLTHDPFLAESLHSMLSNITAIRSTSKILRDIDDLEPAQQARFHTIIHQESRRLTSAAQALVSYFDHASDQTSSNATPEETLDAFLERNDYAFPALDLNPADPGDFIQGHALLENPQSQALVLGFLETYAKDAKQMPLDEFLRAAALNQYNPDILGKLFNTGLPDVFRRLAHLKRPDNDAPAFGLVVVNAAGRALLRRPLVDFALPRHGNACPRWPLFSAFTQTGRPITALLELPGGQQFFGLAIAQPSAPHGFGETAIFQASMLVIPVEHQNLVRSWLPESGAVHKIGITCRICPRTDCTARAETQILALDSQVT